jgi:hypothetical protein
MDEDVIVIVAPAAFPVTITRDVFIFEPESHVT